MSRRRRSVNVTGGPKGPRTGMFREAVVVLPPESAFTGDFTDRGETHLLTAVLTLVGRGPDD